MQKSLFFNHRRGFTLIELLVVIAIVGILVSVSWEILGGVKKASDVKNACEQVASMINKTRNYALSGKVVGASVPASFSIEITGSVIKITSNLPTTTMETFNIPGGISCGLWSSTYSPPNAIGSNTATINCTDASGVLQAVAVTPHQAVCN